MKKATPETVGAILKEYYHEDAVMHTCHPFKLEGLDNIMEIFYKPLVASFPDMRKGNYILMAGQYKGDDWVDIPAN